MSEDLILKEKKNAEIFVNKNIDYFSIEENKKVRLTTKNAYAVEAMLMLDSNYNKASNENNRPSEYYVCFLKFGKYKEFYSKEKKEKLYDECYDECKKEKWTESEKYKRYLDEISKDANNKIKSEYGSGAYWIRYFVEWLINKKNFITIKTNERDLDVDVETILKGVICSIDRENHTHLTADHVGRTNVFERIKKELENKNDFIEKLVCEGKFELIPIISTPNNGKYSYKNKKNEDKNKIENYHFSFATKFCKYICLKLVKELSEKNKDINKSMEADKYYIYDSILSENIKYYTDTEQQFKEIKDKIDGLNKEAKTIKEKEENDNKQYVKMLQNVELYYGKYWECLEKIRNGKISRNAFDHIIWYFNK